VIYSFLNVQQLNYGRCRRDGSGRRPDGSGRFRPVGSGRLLVGPHSAPQRKTPHVAAFTKYHTAIKSRSEFRNVGDAAYAMSHTAAEACTQRLTVGRGHGYRLAAPSLQPDRGICSGVVQPAECE